MILQFSYPHSNMYVFKVIWFPVFGNTFHDHDQENMGSHSIRNPTCEENRGTNLTMGPM